MSFHGKKDTALEKKFSLLEEGLSLRYRRDLYPKSLFMGGEKKNPLKDRKMLSYKSRSDCRREAIRCEPGRGSCGNRGTESLKKAKVPATPLKI